MTAIAIWFGMLSVTIRGCVARARHQASPDPLDARPTEVIIGLLEEGPGTADEVAELIWRTSAPPSTEASDEPPEGHNAQAAITRGQIIVAAEIAVESPDFGHLEPAVRAALRELDDVGVTDRPETVVADAGYWHTRQMENIV